MVRPRSRLVRPGRREYGLAFGSVAKSYACGAWLLGLQVQGWAVWRLAATRSARLGWTSWRTDSPGGSWPERGEAGASVAGYSSGRCVVKPRLQKAMYILFVTRVESFELNKSANIQVVWRPGRLSPLLCKCTVHLLQPPSGTECVEW
jgi:hypothetical protein